MENKSYDNGFRDGKLWARDNPTDDNEAWMIFGFQIGMGFMFVLSMLGWAIYG